MGLHLCNHTLLKKDSDNLSTWLSSHPNRKRLINVYSSYGYQSFANLQEMERQLNDLEAKASSAGAFDFTGVPQTISRFQWYYNLAGEYWCGTCRSFTLWKNQNGIKFPNIFYSTPKWSALVQATCPWFPGHFLGAAGTAIASFETACSEIFWNQIIFVSVKL